MTNHFEEIKKLIASQTEGLPIDEVEELALDSVHFGKFTPEIKGELEKYPNLISLALNDCSLKNLDNFPNIPGLIKLELIDNQLNSSCFPHIVHQKNLQSLSLGGNQFSNFDELKPLTVLENLIDLDLFGCKLCENKEYRKKCFELFPKLEILDNCDVDGKEIEDEDLDDEEDGSEDEDEFEEDGDEYNEDEDDDDDQEEEEEEEDEDEDEKKASKNKKAKK